MPTISIFYGVSISMYVERGERHHTPHIHAKYGKQKASFSISDGSIIAGELDFRKEQLVRAWIFIHQEDLLENWELAMKGERVLPIEPLR